MLNSMAVIILGFFVYLIAIVWRFKKGKSIGQQFLFTVFWVYAVAVVSVTFFPFPFQPRLLQSLRQMGNPPNNFIPFRDIYMMATHDSLHDFIRQVGGNVVLFFPFGFLLPLLSRRASKFRKALIVGMVCSAGIELMQLVLDTLLGYNYRTCDIDDFILNTCGFIIGYIVLSIVKRFVPISKFTEYQTQNSNASLLN